LTDPSAAPLSPDIAQSIRTSGTPLLERRVDFRNEFHACMVELMPEATVMSEPAGEDISQSLVNCVLWAVFASEPAPVIGATLQNVGLEIHRLGFPREGYQAVGHALLRTLRGFYPDWSGTMSSAWIGYHAWLCEHWLRGAQMGALEDQARRAVDPAWNAAGATAPAVVDDDAETAETLGYGEMMVAMTTGRSRQQRRRDEQRLAEEQRNANGF
jgi:hemoglobin-like flavoprotein